MKFYLKAYFQTWFRFACVFCANKNNQHIYTYRRSSFTRTKDILEKHQLYLFQETQFLWLHITEILKYTMKTDVTDTILLNALAPHWRFQN